MLRRREPKPVTEKYIEVLDTLARVLNNFGEKLEEQNTILRGIYEAGTVSPLKENFMWDLIQVQPFNLTPGASRDAITEEDFKGRGFLVNSLVACNSNLLGMEVRITVRGREYLAFRGTILDLQTLGRVNPNSRPPSGGLWCSVVGPPLFVCELEMASLYSRPFDKITLRMYNTSPTATITVSRLTMAYIYFIEEAWFARLLKRIKGVR